MPLPPYLLERLKRRKIIQHDEEPVTELSQPTSPRRYEVVERQINDIEKLDEQEEIIAEDYSDEEEEIEKEEANEEEEGGGGGGEVGEEEQDDGTIEKDENETINDDQDRLKEETNIRETDKSFNSENIQQKNKDDDLSHDSVIGCPNKYNIYHQCSKYCLDNYSKPKSLTPSREQRKQLAFLLKTYPMSNEWTVVYDPGVKSFYFWNIISNLVSWLPPSMNGFISLPADKIRKEIRKSMEEQSRECATGSVQK